MSYIRLHKERKELKDKIPMLVEKEKYEEIIDINELFSLSKENPRKFLLKNSDDPSIRLEDAKYNMELKFIFDVIVLSTYEAQEKFSLVNPTFIDGYYYYIAKYKNDLISEEIHKMLEDDLGSDVSDMDKIYFLMRRILECSLTIDDEDLEGDEIYKIIMEREREKEKVE